MTRRASRGSVDVDLVEDGAAGAPMPSPSDRRDPATRRWSRAERGALVLAAGLAFVVLLGGVPAAPPAPPDTPRWLVPWQTAGSILGSVDEVVLVTGPDGTGIQALDATHGDLLWGPSVPGADCSLVTGPAALCTRSRYSSGGPVATALDLEGEVLGTFVPTGSVLALWSVADDVVVLGRDVGHLLATRWRPTTGTTVWQYRSSDPVVAPAGYPFWAEVVGDQIVVGGTRAVVVGLSDGREMPAVQRSGSGPAADDGRRWQADRSRSASSRSSEVSSPGLGGLRGGLRGGPGGA